MSTTHSDMFNQDDEIWDELKYWIKNPVTSREKLAREQELRAYIDLVLENTVGVMM